MIRILQINDIHPQVAGTYAGKIRIDPSTGLSLTLTDCRLGLQACLDWESEHPCDLAVLAGDLFDVSRPWPDENALIVWFIMNLLDHMPVVAIHGNHDVDVNTQAATALEPLKLLAGAYRQVSAPHELHIITQPDRVLIQTAKGPVCVAGLPYPSKGRFQAAAGSVEQGAGPEVVMGAMNDALRDLVHGMNGGLHPSAPNIMLAHGTVSGATVGEQPRSIAHDLMIPLDAMSLYDGVFLGHIHKHQHVGPNAWYSGSLLCQTFGEKDEVKGWCVAEIERGQLPKVEHIPNPHSRKFEDVTIDSLWHEAKQALEYEVYPGDGIYRIIGQVNEADSAEAQLAIAKFERDHPFVQNNIKVIKPEDRVRDATITTLLSADEAVEKVVRTLVPEESVSAVMARHQEIQARA